MLRQFTSRHLALGILEDANFEAQLDSYVYETECQLIMVSDGLIEARNAGGEWFGVDRLTSLCTEASPSVRSRALRSAIHGHLHYQQPTDDISLVSVVCTRSM